MSAVILNATAVAQFLHHLQIVLGTHLDALGFKEFLLFFEILNLLAKFSANGLHGGLDFVCLGDELFSRENGD